MMFAFVAAILAAVVIPGLELIAHLSDRAEARAHAHAH